MKSPEEMWADYQAGTSWPVVSELIYTLYERVTWGEDGIPRQLWEVTQLGRDADGELLPCSDIWPEFARDHLGMHKSTASKYKRVWQVYHVELGYSAEEMLRAGLFKLGAAVGIVAEMLQGVPYGVHLRWIAQGAMEPQLWPEQRPIPKGSAPPGTYFIMDEHNRLKIGYSAVGATARLNGLQVANADKLTLLYVGAGNLEQSFHARFAASHIRGEWFNVSSEIAKFLSGAGCSAARYNNEEDWGIGSLDSKTPNGANSRGGDIVSLAIAKWGTSLDNILALDTDRAMARTTIPLIQELWPVLQGAGNMSDVYRAALIYSLYETTVEEDGIPRAKWELTRIAKNPDFDPAHDEQESEWMPYSQTWPEFCMVHLEMHKKTASKYKRVIEVFVEQLGYGLGDLVQAGVFKLGAAVSALDKMLKAGEGVDQRLITALFGNKHTCSLCNEFVAFPPDEPPAVCPHCGGDYQGAQPWSGPRTLLLLQQLRGAKVEQGQEKLAVFASLERSYDDDGDVVAVSLLAECGFEGGEKSSLPSWDLNVVDDGVPLDELGIRQAHLQSLENWFRRKFPGA